MPAPFTIKKSRYSEFRDLVNKRSLTRSFVISKFGCTTIHSLILDSASNIVYDAVSSRSFKHMAISYAETF